MQRFLLKLNHLLFREFLFVPIKEVKLPQYDCKQNLLYVPTQVHACTHTLDGVGQCCFRAKQLSFINPKHSRSLWQKNRPPLGHSAWAVWTLCGQGRSITWDHYAAILVKENYAFTQQEWLANISPLFRWNLLILTFQQIKRFVWEQCFIDDKSHHTYMHHKVNLCLSSLCFTWLCVYNYWRKCCCSFILSRTVIKYVGVLHGIFFGVKKDSCQNKSTKLYE